MTINTTFDTNDRMVRETAVISHELEVNSLDVVDGVVVTEVVTLSGHLKLAQFYRVKSQLVTLDKS